MRIIKTNQKQYIVPCTYRMPNANIFSQLANEKKKFIF